MLKDLLQVFHWRNLRNVHLLVCGFGLLVSGCTSPTQRIAASALSRGIAQDKAIVADLVLLNKQHIGDKYLGEVKRAVVSGDVAAAEAAYIAALNEYNKVSWLQIQHERTHALFLFGVRYIAEQEGIFDILKEEYDQAKMDAETASGI